MEHESSSQATKTEESLVMSPEEGNLVDTTQGPIVIKHITTATKSNLTRSNNDSKNPAKITDYEHRIQELDHKLKEPLFLIYKYWIISVFIHQTFQWIMCLISLISDIPLFFDYLVSAAGAFFMLLAFKDKCADMAFAGEVFFILSLASQFLLATDYRRYYPDSLKEKWLDLRFTISKEIFVVVMILFNYFAYLYGAKKVKDILKERETLRKELSQFKLVEDNL